MFIYISVLFNRRWLSIYLYIYFCPIEIGSTTFTLISNAAIKIVASWIPIPIVIYDVYIVENFANKYANRKTFEQ